MYNKILMYLTYITKKNHLQEVTTVFRSYETGLREATIYPKVRRQQSFVRVKYSITDSKQMKSEMEFLNVIFLGF
jgi:hypothetical protein